MGDDDLGQKVRRLNVSEVLEHISPEGAFSPQQRVQRAVARTERACPGWTGRLSPESLRNGYYKVLFTRELARVDLLVAVDAHREVVALEAEVSFLEYPLRTDALSSRQRLTPTLRGRARELERWLNRQASRYALDDSSS